MVEHQLPKLRVASSILVTRSRNVKPSEDLLNPLRALCHPFGAGGLRFLISLPRI
jgi:hypothetical protein